MDVEFREIPQLVFAQQAQLVTNAIANIESVSFRVVTKPGNRSADVKVSYSRGYLERKGSLDVDAGTVSFAVFGLYADYANQVEVLAEFANGQQLSETFMLQTSAYPKPNLDLQEIIVHRHVEGSGLNFMVSESLGPSVIVFDIDGEHRWISPEVGEIVRTHLYEDDYWVVASAGDSSIYRIFWDGSFEAFEISDHRYVDSHHNMDFGKFGIFNNVGFVDGHIHKPESVLIELESDGAVLKSWDFDEIFSQLIISSGDPTDDSVLASSRENFVVKADYDTGEIKWLLGNPNKLWYTDFPNSLQPLALTVIGRPPIGQHSLVLSSGGKRLLLFNNGFGNLNLPNVGDQQAESVVSIYEIDEELRTAEEVWSYDHMPPIFSAICSSVDWLPDGNILVTYSQIFSAVIDGTQLGQHSRLVLINGDREVLYEASILKRENDIAACFSAYKTKAIGLDDFRFK
jgi:hypothetical protein